MTTQRLVRAPIFWILAIAAALRLAGLFWGLPASDGWDNDGFAPRNFLTALALTWKPGAYFTYPPLHAILLAIPSLPVAGWALAHAPSLSQHDVIATITKPVYMTYFSVVARLTSLFMSLGIVWCAGAMAQLVAGRRAGLMAAGACALCVGLTYYGQVSNLDVPYLFWAMLALLFVMRGMVERAPRWFWWAALSAAAAVATKDQAYAVFVLSLPLIVALWFAVDAWPRAHAKAVAAALLPAAAVAIAALLLIDGAITNPGGFARRIAFLVGPASQDYATYVHGPAGWLALLQDMVTYFARGPGLIPFFLAALGAALHLWRTTGDKGKWTAGLLPLLAMVSFTICFNFAALRSDDRFLLPQAVLATVYVGISVEALVCATRPWLRIGGRVAVAVAALFAVHYCIAIEAAMLMDPRYDAEAWLRGHIRPGDTIETYGQNCFLPRFPPSAAVSRVGQGDLALRNPLPGVTEVKAAFGGARDPRFIVVSANWVQRYLRPDRPLGPGRTYSRIQQEDWRNADARDYFAKLHWGKLDYQLAHVSRYDAKFWPPIHIHDSLDESIRIFERTP